MKIPALVLAAAMSIATSCVSDSNNPGDTITDDSKPFTTGDLEIFELHGRVRNATRTTYYNVKLLDGDSLDVDTSAVNRVDTKIFFDTLGHYVKRRNERVERDSHGRMTHWSDSRPNIKGLHGGFLRDTLRYRHISSNLLESTGMGQYSTTIYDDNHRIVGQYTAPLSADAGGDTGACFNIYRDYDEKGNWTERMTVWITRGTTSSPHVSYTVDRREIVYYP